MGNLDLGILISQIFVAVGTIFLAIVTFFSIRGNNSQLKYLKQQVKILKNDRVPLIKVLEKKFDKNLLTIKIKNFGEKSAFKIGVESSFLLAKSYRSGSGKFEFGFNPKKLKDLNKGQLKEAKAEGFVVWNAERKTIFLAPNEEMSLTFVPKFGLRYITPNGLFSGDTIGRFFDLKELFKIIKSNAERFIEINLQLRYQDYGGTLKERVPLFRNILDIKKDKSLEDCFDQNRSGSLTAVGPEESEIRLEGNFAFMYDSLSDPKKDIE